MLLGQRGLHVLGAGLFAVFVPRLMGPEMFGRYALLTSVAMWFGQLSGLGAVSMITRTVPGFVAAGDLTGLRKLVTSLLALRGTTGVLSATGFAAFVTLALGIGDWVSVAWFAGAVCCRAVGNLCFTLFLGLNRAARWGAGDLLRRWLTLAFVLIGVPVAGLRGACAGFFLSSLVVLVVGGIQARPYVRWADVDLSRRYLAPFVRIGTAFAAGNLLLALAQRSGETVVRLSTGDFAEVAYYGAAYGVYLTIAHSFWQMAIAFAPFLVARFQAGDVPVVVAWLERLLKWMVIVATPVVAATIAFGGDLVPWLLGPAYQPVATNLVPLTFALFALAANSTGRLAVLALDRPGVSAVAAALELAAFWLLGLVLAPRWESLGVACAALAASVLSSTWITLRVRRELPYALRAPLIAGLLGGSFAPVVWSASTTASGLGVFAVSFAAYAGLLWRFGIVTRDELRSMRQVWGLRGQVLY